MFDEKLYKREHKKKYYAENIERLRAYSRNYYKDNLEKVKKQNQIYRISNKQKIKSMSKIYYQTHKHKIINYQKMYAISNSMKINSRYKLWRKQKYILKDFQYIMTKRLRANLNQALRKYSKTGKIFYSKKYGIDYHKIIEHLKPFPEDISKYHIDHIRPLCSFDLNNLDEIKKAFTPENHQWLLARDNIRKGSKY